jgi:sulfur-oxidizing protein SoxY
MLDLAAFVTVAILNKEPFMQTRRDWLRASIAVLPWAGAQSVLAQSADPFDGDPYKTHVWAGIKKEFYSPGKVVLDSAVTVSGPKFAEDPMNVPITVSVKGLTDIDRMVVVVDRNPIRKVLEFFPMSALPAVGFRFKLEQASPVRVGVLTRDGIWHVGHTWVDSSGGGCTASAASRKDGTWHQTLGQVQGRTFSSAPEKTTSGVSVEGGRLRVRVMHPMDTGLVGGVPAFFVNKLAVSDAKGRLLLKLNTFEPVSENPVFSFDFSGAIPRPLQLSGTDNNGNRIEAKIDG